MISSSLWHVIYVSNVGIRRSLTAGNILQRLNSKSHLWWSLDSNSKPVGSTSRIKSILSLQPQKVARLWKGSFSDTFVFVFNFKSVQKSCSSKTYKQKQALQCCSWGPVRCVSLHTFQSISNSLPVSTRQFQQVCSPSPQLQESHKKQRRRKTKCAGKHKRSI